MAQPKDPRVKGDGKYTETGQGPNVDAASYDKRTPFAGERYRSMEQQDSDEPVYVIDETSKSATPAGMISRKELASREGHAAEKEEESNTLAFILAGVLMVAILILGVVGVIFTGADATVEKIESELAAEAAKAPPGPDEIQGVNVRKGMKHNPTAPPKRSDLQPAVVPEDDVEEVPLNAVPDGGRPSDAAPAAEPDAGDATDAPSGDPQ